MGRPSIVVVGGGIAGLAAAWEIAAEESVRVEVIEGSSRLGGALAGATWAGREVDLGPDGFLARRPEAVGLVTELGLADRLEPIGASGASIFLRGRAWPLPDGLALGVPTSSSSLRGVGGLTWRARLAARRDELAPRRLAVGEDATVGEIVRTKLGAELAYRFVEPMVGGIQAGRIDDLSAAEVFPALLAAARRGGSLMRALRVATAPPAAREGATTPLFCSFAGGLGALVAELRDALVARGVVIREGAPVSAVRETPAGDYPLEVDTESTTTPASALVLATPGGPAASLLGSRDERLAALGAVPYASTAMVTFALGDDTPLPERGTGMLVPLATPWPGEGSMMVTALTFLDRKWPSRRHAGEVLVRCHVGRSDDLRHAALDDEALAARARDELTHLLGGLGEVRATLVQRWPAALPQYRVGHRALVEAARAAAEGRRIVLAGSLYDGVGVPASIRSGRRAARQALDWVR
jgi:oxygen-dependent protoporphyrinogen oxidase